MMEVSTDPNFTDSGLFKVSLDNSVQNEVEDGELVEDTNVVVTEEEKKILRAKRFGPVDNVSIPKIQDPKLQRLYKRMKISNDTRLEALHLHGTDNLKTEDIFAIFSGYIPASIEWLTDKTCNAVWLDEESCAKALQNCSARIRGQDPEESDDSEEEEYINKEDIRCALPPGGIWRRSHATQLAPNLLVRFATYSDRRGNKPNHLHYNDTLRKNIVFLDEGDEVARKSRPDTGNPWGDIAREWSNFEMRTAAAKKQDDRLPVRDARDLISRNGRIPPPIVASGGSALGGKKWSSLDYWNEEDLTMMNAYDRVISGRKMQADIEEKKILSKKLRSKSGIDLRQRLSKKRPTPSYDDLSEEEEESSDELKSHKRQKCRRKRTLAETSWTRGDSEDSASEERNYRSSSSEDLRRKLRKNTNIAEPTDSRGKSEKKVSSVLTQSTKKFIPDTPLQIEIDNDIYYERVNRNH